MTIAIIILLSFLLAVSIIQYINSVNEIKILKTLNSKMKPLTELDVKLTDLNYFVRKEFLFEFLKWISSSLNVVNMSDPDHTSDFVYELKDTDLVNKKVSIMTSLIYSKMSDSLKSSFEDIYNNEDNYLLEYIGRLLFFYIRRVNYDITTLFESNPKTPTSALLKMYTISIETEIYNLNEVDIISVKEPTDYKNSGATN